MIAGFEVTPAAMAIAPLATEAKVPAVVMAAGTSAITERSPYIARTSFTLPQSSVIIADWAAKNNIKKVVTIVSDYAPGADAEKWFVDTFKKAGGEVTEMLKVPLMAPDFSPFLQRAADAKPDAIFIFVPSGQGAAFMKQYTERGLDKAGIKVIGTGDVTDDDLLPQMGDAVIGVVTAHMYSADHPSEMNKKYVEAFTKANNFRPNFMSVGGYDGMHLIYEAVKKAGGKTRRRFADRGDEGHEVGKPARPDVDRSGHARRRAEHLHAQGREEERTALQRRIPDLRRTSRIRRRSSRTRPCARQDAIPC